MRTLATLCAAALAVLLVTGGRTTYEPPDGASDGYLKRATAAGYDDACTGSKAALTSGTAIYVGQRYLGSNEYDVWKGFLRFDLTGLSGTVESDTLYLWIWARGAEDYYALRVHTLLNDWYPLDTTDWSTAWSDTSTRLWSELVNGEWIEFPDVGSVPGEVLALRLETTMLCNIVPDGAGRAKIMASEGANGPYLAVNTAEGRHIIRAVASTGGGHADASGLQLARSGNR